MKRTAFLLGSYGLLGAATIAIAACDFQMSAGSSTQKPQTPANAQQPQQPQATPVTPGPAPTPTPGAGRGLRLGRAKTAPTVQPTTNPTAPQPTVNPTVTPTSPTPTPGAIPTMAGQNAFGNGTSSAEGWAGAVYWLPPNTQKIPDLDTIKPAGYFFANKVDTSLRLFPEGWPGIDPNRRTDFAIHLEASLVVDNEADYEFRLASDDGSFLEIDGMKLIDLDGVHTWQDRKAPVHLVKATHLVAIDYFQTQALVGLQLFCNKVGSPEQICPLRL